MRKVIAAFNMTLDGICDHTIGIADDQTHQHYADLLNEADTILYGRTTYQLMESHWPSLVKNPSGNKSHDEFALSMQNIHKIVFSRTLKSVSWENSSLAKRDLKEEVTQLKQQTGRDILVGSRSLIVALLNLGLIDEFQLCIQPIIAASGLSLLDNITDRIDLKLLNTKTFNASGIVLFYYKPIKK